MIKKIHAQKIMIVFKSFLKTSDVCHGYVRVVVTKFIVLKYFIVRFTLYGDKLERPVRVFVVGYYNSL